jgi:predicted nucleic acid-binding protein
VSGRAIVDTDVYIEVLRASDFVAAQRRMAQALLEPFERVRRVLTPTHAMWRDAGDVLPALGHDRPSIRSAVSAGLVNDFLIALTARAIGGTVLTGNRRHFEMIRDVRQFGLEAL